MKFILNIIISLLLVLTVIGVTLKYFGWERYSWFEVFTPIIVAFVIKYIYSILKEKLKIS